MTRKHLFVLKQKTMIHICIEMCHIQQRKSLETWNLVSDKNLPLHICSIACRNSETLVHLLKGSLGTGILAMPKAFHQAGYVSGFLNTLIIGVICTYGLHILVSRIGCNVLGACRKQTDLIKRLSQNKICSTLGKVWFWLVINRMIQINMFWTTSFNKTQRF